MVVLVEEVIMLWVLVLVGRLYRHSVLGLCHTIHAEIFLFVFVFVVVIVHIDMFLSMLYIFVVFQIIVVYVVWE